MWEVTPAEVLPAGPVTDGAMSGTGSVLCPAAPGPEGAGQGLSVSFTLSITF